MKIKILLVCNLLWLNAIGINKKAIASPDLEVRNKQTETTSPWPQLRQPRFLTIPQWSEPIDARYLNIPQWSEPIDARYLNIPQWSEQREISPRTTPQWSEVGSPQTTTISQPFPKPSSSFELLPHVVPGAAGKQVKELNGNPKKSHPSPAQPPFERGGKKGREQKNQALAPLKTNCVDVVSPLGEKSSKHPSNKLHSLCPPHQINYVALLPNFKKTAPRPLTPPFQRGDGGDRGDRGDGRIGEHSGEVNTSFARGVKELPKKVSSNVQQNSQAEKDLKNEAVFPQAPLTPNIEGLEGRSLFELKEGDFFLSNFELEQGKWEVAQGVNISTEKTPLSNQHFQLPTAGTLGKGQVMFNFGSRLFFLPKSIGGDDDTAAYPYVGFTWGITNNLELTLEAQRVDTASPGIQGEFKANRSPDETNFFLSEFQELSLDLKQKFWQNQEQDLMFSGVLSLSWGSRGYSFRTKNGVLVDEGENSGIVPALQFPFTTRIQERLSLTISPTIAFFSDENALHFHRPPTDDPGSFGTTFGLTGAVSFEINPRLTLWGDAFFPFTGNNSINQESGKPDKAIAYNAGFRYLVNPRIGLDIFASNTLGSTGPLALTADRNFTAFAANLVFFPSFIGANRELPDSFNNSEEPRVITTDGVGFFDGGTLPSGKFLVDLQGGSQGILTSLRYGVLRDLELGIYLDYIWGDVDESEQGFSGKLQFLNQAAGAPLTVSLAATIGLTNQPFVNFINDDRHEFDQLGLDKGIPFFFQGDNKSEGQLFIATFSLPLHYQFNNGAAVWLTPTLGYVQREGTEIAGFNVGGSFPVGNFSFVGEIGANLTNDGNAFIGNSRENVIPWTFAVRWGNNNNKIPQLELYLTNRVGSSAWHQLRVRDQNETAVGLGLSIPF